MDHTDNPDYEVADVLELTTAGQLQALGGATRPRILALLGQRAATTAQLAAAQAKIAIDRFSYATAAKLFDVGGASATQKVHNLDRHWRNARVASTHNPTFLKASAVGDHHVNGASFPGNAYF